MVLRRSVLGLLCGIAACGPPKQPAAPAPLPRAAYAAYLDGKLAAYRDEWGNAADALADAAAAAPEQPMIAVELARAQHKAKRPEAARATLTAARARWPRHPQVWLASGDLLAASAPALAIDAYRKAIALDPDLSQAWRALAAALARAKATAELDQLGRDYQAHFGSPLTAR